MQLIKDRLSIVDVISPYVELHKAGKNFKGKSPFTPEKTPSFFVSPERGMYYCFSSSQGGDMFTFIQKMEGVDFKGALKILADKAGVELVPEDPKKRDLRDNLFAVLDEATRFFEKELAKNPTAEQYLKDRSVTPETKKQWRIGYAPDDWRKLKEYLNSLGHKDELLLQAGLVKRADGGKQPYDVFRDRIMFPIMDQSGRVIAFSGRILKKDSDSPKYVNSPETALFNKSEALFGYDKAKHGIHKLDFSMIVEGQFDVVLSHQAGYHNTVAVSGTALTAQHISLLQRLSNRVVLALDADKAGIAAVKRAAELALGRGIDLKVARIIGGKDPADLVKEDPRLLRQAIGGAVHVIEYLLAILKNEVKDERSYKLRARDEILPYVMLIESHIERDHWCGVIADSVGTSVDAIRSEVTRLESEKRQGEVKTHSVEPVVNTVPPAQTRERKVGLMEYLATLHSLLPIAEQHLLAEGFLLATGQTPAEASKKIAPERSSELIFKLEEQVTDTKPRQLREDWEDKLKELTSLIAKEEIAVSKHELIEAEKAGDENAAERALARIETLRAKLGVR